MSKRAKPSLVLDLPKAGARHGITPAVWASWVEAAAVTLERFPAPSSKHCMLASGRLETPGVLKWRRATPQMRASHANEHNATEHGAYAIASTAQGELEGWTIMDRAQHASGADILMLSKGRDDDEEFVRLEVSGMAEGRIPRLGQG